MFSSHPSKFFFSPGYLVSSHLPVRVITLKFPLGVNECASTNNASRVHSCLMPGVSWDRLWMQLEQDTALNVDESVDEISQPLQKQWHFQQDKKTNLSGDNGIFRMQGSFFLYHA